MKPLILTLTVLLAITLTALFSTARAEEKPSEKKEASSKPRVLFIVASTHFYYQEYGEPKEELNKAGYEVDVTAYAGQCVPHENSGQPKGNPNAKVDVRPDQVDPSKYKAVLFVGGWGASQYQYAFKGKYKNGAYNLSEPQRKRINDIVNAFIKDKKPVGAICYGTTALAWCRNAEGNSPIKGRRSAVPNFGGPAFTAPDGKFYNEIPNRNHITDNGGTPVSLDDKQAPTNVVVDGQFITAQDNRTARAFGKAIIKAIQENGKTAE